jgi:hypothetical protein
VADPGGGAAGEGAQRAGKAAFDAFELRADEITNGLNGSLNAIPAGRTGMDTAFGTGDQELETGAHRNMGAANFGAARFGAR